MDQGSEVCLQAQPNSTVANTSPSAVHTRCQSHACCMRVCCNAASTSCCSSEGRTSCCSGKAKL